MKVFVDNDVILDVLLERSQFAYSSKIIEFIEKGKIKGLTSPIIFTNTFFLVSKARDRKVAWEALRKLRILFKITKVNQDIVDKAMASGFTDFEDAIQYYSALSQKADYLVTRNKKDYISGKLAIVTPKEAIAVINDITK